jgi:hypothetical protein
VETGIPAKTRRFSCLHLMIATIERSHYLVITQAKQIIPVVANACQ